MLRSIILTEATSFSVNFFVLNHAYRIAILLQIMGGEEGVLDCKDHLLNIQEEYLQDAIDEEYLREYEKPPSRSADKSLSKNSTSDGFKVVKGAP